MKRTISKKITIALLSALVAVCMGFVVLLSRPAAQANAEELNTFSLYTLTFMDGENVLGTIEATEGDKLSSMNMSSINTEKEGFRFKGWSYTENGEVLDLEAETVTNNSVLYAVYKKLFLVTVFTPRNVTMVIEEGQKLSDFFLSCIPPEGYVFKGFSYTENGEILDLTKVIVDRDMTLCAVYDKVDNPSNMNEVNKVIGIIFGILLTALVVEIAFCIKRYHKKQGGKTK